MEYYPVFLLCMMVLTVFILTLDTHKKRNKKENPDQDVAINLSNEEFYKTLNFMLMYGIIDTEEYNQIQLKGLPYVTKGKSK